ncbi:MAG: hypothetical protein ACMZ66_00225 [Thalassospira sp.]|uniref:hypothetical protein n=1 Tax=Thalassospira sp. TaxID=1912094 RepID=UPI003A89C02F
MNPTQVEHIFRSFLDDHPDPSSEDWRALLQRYPEYTEDIVHRAISHGSRLESERRQIGARTLTFAQNLLQSQPSPVLEAVDAQLTAVKGPQVRDIARQIGLGEHVNLLNGVLVGRTQAPVRVLSALETYFDAPAMVLRAVFEQRFAASVVPAFKATREQPQVTVEPTSWVDAVHSLELSTEETTRLLQMAEDD